MPGACASRAAHFVNNSISLNRFYSSFKLYRLIEYLVLQYIGVSCCRQQGAVSEYFNVYIIISKVVVIVIYFVVVLVVVFVRVAIML